MRLNRFFSSALFLLVSSLSGCSEDYSQRITPDVRVYKLKTIFVETCVGQFNRIFGVKSGIKDLEMICQEIFIKAQSETSTVDDYIKYYLQQRTDIQKKICEIYLDKAERKSETVAGLQCPRDELTRAEDDCNLFIKQSTNTDEILPILYKLLLLNMVCDDIQKQIKLYEQTINIATNDEIKEVYTFDLLNLLYSKKMFDELEEKANYFITTTKNSKSSLYSLYYLAKIYEERQQYQLSVTYYEEYITDYYKKINNGIITNKDISSINGDEFIFEHPIDLIIAEKDQAIQKIQIYKSK